jgi:hypothetical protein
MVCIGYYWIAVAYLVIDCSVIVTKELLEKVYLLMQMGSTNTGSTQNTLLDTEELDPEQHLHFINALDMPRVVYSAERKVFEKCVTGFSPKRITCSGFS